MKKLYSKFLLFITLFVEAIIIGLEIMNKYSEEVKIIMPGKT
jgi:hypothetical protein